MESAADPLVSATVVDEELAILVTINRSLLANASFTKKKKKIIIIMYTHTQRFLHNCT